MRSLHKSTGPHKKGKIKRAAAPISLFYEFIHLDRAF